MRFVHFFRTSDGLYLPLLMLSKTSFRCSIRHGSASSMVIPSTPPAPFLAFPRLYALFQLSVSRTFSSSSAPSLSTTYSLSALYASAYFSSSILFLCKQPPFPAYYVFAMPTSFVSLLKIYDCSALPQFFLGTMASTDFS